MFRRDGTFLARRSSRAGAASAGEYTWDSVIAEGPTIAYTADAGITEAGTGVSSWVDRISSLDAVQATDANRPTYAATGLNGKPCVTFVKANNDLLAAVAAPAVTSESYVLIMLIDHVSTQAIDYVFDHAGPTRQIAQLGSSPSASVGWFDATTHRPVAAATTGVQVLRWTGNEATELLTVYRDASSLGTAAWAAAGAHTINSGALGIGGAYNAVSAAPCDVKIRHAVWFDSIDNARDARVEAFFMSDGGL